MAVERHLAAGEDGDLFPRTVGTIFFGLKAQAAAEIKVRWADGSASTHPVSTDQTTVELVAPTR